MQTQWEGELSGRVKYMYCECLPINAYISNAQIVFAQKTEDHSWLNYFSIKKKIEQNKICGTQTQNGLSMSVTQTGYFCQFTQRKYMTNYMYLLAQCTFFFFFTEYNQTQLLHIYF